MWYVILNPRKRVYNQIAIENLVNPLPPPPAVAIGIAICRMIEKINKSIQFKKSF